MMALSLLLLAACGKNEPAQDYTTPADVVAQPEQIQPETEPAKVDAEVSESDFRTASLGDGKCELVGCSATAKVIQVPETLYGETVVGIGNNAFALLDAKKIILPDTVEYITEYAFSSCNKLEEVDLGNGLKKTGLFTFNDCNELRSVSFPDGMEEMTEVCFGICEKLGEVYVPASVTTFGNLIDDPALCPNVVIVTPAGSAAEANALEYGIPVRNP